VTKSKKKQFPINWKPYPFQVKLWNYLVGGGKQAVAVWHRRSGKDIVGLHWIISCALAKPGLYWYVFPTFEQAKLAIWDAVTLDGRSYLSFIPESTIAKLDNANLTIKFKNGSIIKLVGSHTPDNLRGAGIKGVIVSEYAEIKKPEAIASVLVPMLIRSKGWVLYLYTPSGDVTKTHGYDLYEKLAKKKNAFAQTLNITQTSDHDGNPLVLTEELEGTGLSKEQIKREFYCDFSAGRLNRDETTFGTQIKIAESEGRITHLPYDSSYTVNTYWDVGVVDYTVIWFVQEKDEYLDIIDCYISRGKDFYFLLTELKNKGYKYGKNVLPHDMGRRQPPKLDTRLAEANQIAAELNFSHFALGRMYHREGMISKARELLGKCRFDATKCQNGLNALSDYDASKRKTNSNSTMMTDVADSFCYLSMDAKTKKDRELLYPSLDVRMHKVIDEYNGGSVVLDYNPFEY
tara:strand:+ start:825 stop:2207 length:1383 start_codon:yes stop_codon:yes gene_type:complete